MTTKEKYEEAAKEYGESFKTGEWFEKLRIEAFLAGASFAEKEKSLDFLSVTGQNIHNAAIDAALALINGNQITFNDIDSFKTILQELEKLKI